MPEGGLNVTSEQEIFEGWVVLELMGHRRLAGRMREQQIGGASFLRLDVEDEAGTPLATQYYSPSAVYCITPTTEEIARAFASRGFDGPVTRWELPQLNKGRDEVFVYGSANEEDGA